MMTKPVTMTHYLLLALLSLLVLAPTDRVAAQTAPGVFAAAPCMFEGIDLGIQTLDGEALGFECGYVTVPVRHDIPDGPILRLPVAIRRAPGGAADPLIMAQGGPGGDAFEVFSLLVPSSGIGAARDIVIFNQRGTPYAEPALTCPETEAILAESLVAELDTSQRLYEEALAACFARLQAEGVDLSAFNSLENAADVPMIAHALGYETYNFYGVSYGTLLGLHLMRNHPEGLRSVILDSVVPPDINFIVEAPASQDRVFREVFAACAADASCAAQYPDLEERFFTLLAGLDADPVTLTLTDPDTGQRYDALVNGRALRGVVQQLLYVPRMAAVLPSLITDLEAGDYRYVQAMWPLLVFEQLIAEGMYYSVICAEDADIDMAAVPLEGLRPEIAATANDEVQSIVDACALWRVEALPATIDEPVTSDIPTLLLSGRFDPITPPGFATTAATGLSNAIELVDPTAAHGVALQSPCVSGIVSDFLADPTTPPDSTCLQSARPMAFMPPDTVTFPLLLGINRLEPRALAIIGITAVLVLILASAFVVWPLVFIIRAFGDSRIERTPQDRRLRWLSRGLVLLFAGLAAIFAFGLLIAIVASLADLTLATGMALPPTAAPLFWLPPLLLMLAVAIIVALVALWRRRGTGSTLGKVYYLVLTLSAVALLALIASQGLLLPRL